MYTHIYKVSSLTMGQLFYILGHIQKLSAQAPVTAHALLAENLRICNALLHAECLAGMIEEPRLPMTAEELRRAKALSRAMQEDIQNAEVIYTYIHTHIYIYIYTHIYIYMHI